MRKNSKDAFMNSMKFIIPLHYISWKKKTPNDAVTPQCQSQFTRFRVCFHLWCELTTTMNVTEWQVSWNSCFCLWVYTENGRYSLLWSWPLRQIVVIVLHFISCVNSFCDISKKCFLPNMIRAVPILIIFGKINFLLKSQNEFTHEIKCNGMTSFMEFKSCSIAN